MSLLIKSTFVYQPTTHYLTISRSLSISTPPSTQMNHTSSPSLEDIETLYSSSSSLEDEAAILHDSSTATTVDYTILHSPTYRVPVLYFYLRNPPPPSSSSSAKSSLDFIYEHLVPSHQRESLQNVSVLGGIGITVSSTFIV